MAGFKIVQKFGLSEKCDKRILGTGGFVGRIIKQADEKINHQYCQRRLLRDRGCTIFAPS